MLQISWLGSDNFIEMQQDLLGSPSKIGVIVPCYNGAKFVQDCLDSIIGQSYPHWEAVVIDDGSTDETFDIVASLVGADPRFRIEKQVNVGVAATRNNGLEYLPKVDAVVFLDQDDRLRHNALELLVATLEANPDAAAAVGFNAQIDEDGNPLPPHLTRIGFRTRFAMVGNRMEVRSGPGRCGLETFLVDCIGTPGQAMIRRKCLEEIGRLDQKMAPSDDWDMWVRLCIDRELVVIAEDVIDRRLHSSNVSGDWKRMHDAHWRCRAKFIRMIGEGKIRGQAAAMIMRSHWVRLRYETPRTIVAIRTGSMRRKVVELYRWLRLLRHCCELSLMSCMAQIRSVYAN